MNTLFLVVAAIASPQETPTDGEVATLSAGGAQDMSGEGVAFVEIDAARRDWYALEPIELTLRFGLEQGFLETAMIQPFRQPLDVPVQVIAPLFQELEGPAGDLKIVLGDDLTRVARVTDETNAGRTFLVYEIRRSHSFDRPGQFVIPRPLLRFAHTSGFREDLISGRVPEDRNDAYVVGTELSLVVRPLPEEGRPPGFSGAVGRIEVRSVAEPRDLVVGQSLKLTLHVDGPGGATFRTPPLLGGLGGMPGFRVYGRTLEASATGSTVTYDLAPDGVDVKEIPGIEVTFFDTEEGGYRTLDTREIPILVRPPAREEPATAEAPRAAPEPDAHVPVPVPVPDPGAGTGTEGGAPEPAQLLTAGALAALAILVVLLLRRAGARRSAGAERPDPARMARIRAAADTYRRASSEPETDPSQALGSFLAACLDCPPAAVIAPDLAQRLAAERIPAELAARTATLLEGLVGARYGGHLPEGAEHVDALVDELVQALLAR